MIFIPDSKSRQLVLCKIMLNCKVVTFFSGFGMDCFIWASEGNYSNLCSVEDFYDYTVSILPLPRPEFSYSLQISEYSGLKPGNQIKTLSADLKLARLPVILFNSCLWLDKSPNAVVRIMLQEYNLIIFEKLIYVIKLWTISSI